MSGSTRLTIVGLAILLGVSACGGAPKAAGDGVAAAPQVEAAQSPTDPYQWSDVRYQDYRAAALQVPISPELLVAPAALTQSLDTLCHTDQAGFATLIAEHETRARAASQNDLDKHLADEVALRLGMACPQRMGDWMTARQGDDVSEASVTQPEVAASGPEETTEPSSVESPQEVEGEKLPENPYVESDEQPASVAGGGS